MAEPASPFIIGWQEWLALPELGLPAIKAKVDTGARTSALHAFLIEPFGSAAAPMVRFGVHPIPGRRDVAIFCSAAISDRREVTSSNGEKETRFFIRTPVALAGRTWPIEIGLTNRESMSYRMLLGRLALRDDMMVDAAGSFRQPRLSYKVYRGMPRAAAVRRPLRLALVARSVEAPFNCRLAAAAAERDHVLELLDLERLALSFADDRAGLLYNGAAALAHYDAVIPRVGRREGAAGTAVVRQFEGMGSFSLNPADAIERAASRVSSAQALVRDRLAQALVPEGPLPASAPTVERQTVLRALVVGDSTIALLSVSGDRVRAVSLARRRTERRLAEHAAAALGLGLAAVDIGLAGERAVVVGISARPALGRFARICDVDVAAEMIDTIEARLRSKKGGAAMAAMAD